MPTQRDAHSVLSLTIVNDAGKRTANAGAVGDGFSRLPIDVTRRACITASSSPLINEQPSCAIFSLSRGVESSGGFVRLLSVVWSA